MSVSVGFAPATTPGLVTGGTTAAGEGDAPEGLFAALLAMLAPGAGADAGAGPDMAGSTDFAALIQSLIPGAAPVPETALSVAAADAPAQTTPEQMVDRTVADLRPADLVQLSSRPTGKSLIKDLGDALIAINDALEAGKPVDPALADKLDETVEALAAMLGISLPSAPTVDQRIGALASGDGALPAIDAAAPVELPSSPPGQVVETAPATDAPEATTAPTTAPDWLEALADIADPETTFQPSAPAQASPTKPAEASAPEQAPPALRDLGLLVGKLAERLEPKDPVLAKKLSALAENLQSGTATDEVLASLGVDDADTDPDLKRIVEALSISRPTVTRPVEAQPFATPALDLPDTVAATEPSDPPVSAPPVSATAPRLEPTSVEPSKPTPVAASSDRDVAPADRSAPQVANTAAPDAGAQASATSQASPPAAPIARTIHAAYQAPVQQVNLPQVAFEVVRQFDAGNSRFQIRLDPPELGRIDVKLDVDKAGTVNARMTVERPETLDLMQRDQRALQQALQQAGLDASRTNLEFSLRQNPFAAQGGMGDGRGQQPVFAPDTDLSAEDPGVEAATTLYRGTATAGGVNLFV